MQKLVGAFLAGISFGLAFVAVVLFDELSDRQFFAVGLLELAVLGLLALRDVDLRVTRAFDLVSKHRGEIASLREEFEAYARSNDALIDATKTVVNASAAIVNESVRVLEERIKIQRERHGMTRWRLYRLEVATHTTPHPLAEYVVEMVEASVVFALGHSKLEENFDDFASNLAENLVHNCAGIHADRIHAALELEFERLQLSDRIYATKLVIDLVRKIRHDYAQIPDAAMVGE